MILVDKIKSKKVLFITSKQIEYIRNVQEIDILKQNASEVKIIGSSSKNYFIRLISTYFKLLFTRKKSFDYIFIGFSPQLFFFFYPFLDSNKLIIDFFISVYDTFIDDRKKVKEGSLISKLMHWVDSYCIRYANLIIVDTKADRDYFSEEFNVSPTKFEVIYLKADTSIYDPNNYPVKIKQKNHLDVLYFGSILPLQGIEVILDTIKSLRNDSRLHFVIVGPIDKKFNLNKEEYPNATFFSWLSQKDLAAQIANSDICLAGHFSGDIGKADRTIAGKTYIYKAMKKPVILGDSRANKELFTEDSMNFYVKRGDSDDLKNKLLEILNTK